MDIVLNIIVYIFIAFLLGIIVVSIAQLKKKKNSDELDSNNDN